MNVRWVAFPLHPQTPAEGLTLEALFDIPTAAVDRLCARLSRTAAELGLAFGDRRKTFNSRLAQELGKWAEDRGRGDAFHRAAFGAYFARGLNLARLPVLLDLAASVQLPRDEARRVIEQRRYRAAVDRDWQKAAEKRVTAVPTFIYADRRLVGAQSYPALKQLVTGEPPAETSAQGLF